MHTRQAHSVSVVVRVGLIVGTLVWSYYWSRECHHGWTYLWFLFGPAAVMLTFLIDAGQTTTGRHAYLVFGVLLSAALLFVGSVVVVVVGQTQGGCIDY